MCGRNEKQDGWWRLIVPPRIGFKSCWRPAKNARANTLQRRLCVIEKADQAGAALWARRDLGSRPHTCEARRTDGILVGCVFWQLHSMKKCETRQHKGAYTNGKGGDLPFRPHACVRQSNTKPTSQTPNTSLEQHPRNKTSTS